MPPAIRFCRSRDGVRIAYAVTGQGPVVVQTPTWLTHLELDWSSAAWRPWIEELSRGRRLVRYDLRGCGLSDRGARAQGLESWVADLEAVVDAVGLDRFPLLGLCNGGTIATAYAARHPDRVSRLVLCGSFARGALAGGSASKYAREALAMGQIIESGWGRALPAFRELFAGMLMPGAPPAVVRDLAEIERESATPAMAARLWEAFHAGDVEDPAGRVRAPTLVFHARHDGMVPFSAGRRLATLIPGARFVTLESRDHILQAGEPAWKRFWQEVDAFLQPDAAAASAGAAFPELTPREREILDQVARGRSNAAIATALRITPKTVRNHVSSIFDKMAVHHRAEAVVRAREAGFGGA